VLLAAAVATAAVGLGLLLGLGSAGGSTLVGPLRTFAFTAALAVAVTHLLPEALGALGAPALLLFAAASVAPAWGGIVRELAGGKSQGSHGRAVLGAGYAGLLVHHVGDGLGLGAYSELPGGPLAHADVLAALAVHTVPLVAVVTLAFRSQRGVRAAVERALGLAAASVGGVLLSGSVPARFTDALSAWIAAGVAGLLLHVVTHDLGRDLPSTNLGRAIDWIAAALGIFTSALGNDPELATLRHSMLDTLTSAATRAAPVLVLGLAAILLAARLAPNPQNRAPSLLPPPLRALDGALLAAPLASIRFGILFWLGTAASTKLTSLLARHRHEHAPRGKHAHGNPTVATHDHAHPGSHAHGKPLDDPREPHAPTTTTALLREYIAWTLTGLVLYALFTAAIAPDALARLSLPLALAGAAVCGLALEVPPVTAVFVAVALWQRGLRPEAALAFAVMATTRPPTRLITLIATLLAGLAAGFLNDGARFAPLPVPLPLGIAALALLTAASVVTVWQHGFRGLFASVFHSHDSV
jgi:ZIP family zinc transporter